MKTSTLLKFLTVFVFILLIGIFVAFRSDAFSTNDIGMAFLSSDTTGPLKTDTAPLTAKDTIHIKSLKDSVNRTLFPSTKSIMIPKNHPSRTPKNDSSSVKDKKRKKAKTD
jgi:hypothetical protein